MLLPFEGAEPSVARTAWVAPSAKLIGDVTRHEQSSVWYTRIPPRSLVAGVPAKVKRELAEGDLERLRRNADVYVALAARHAAARAGGPDGNKTASPNA